MIVVAIITILTAVGIGMSSDLVPRFRTRQAARTFAAKVNECRSLAIRSGKECSVWLLAADTSLTNLSSNTGEYWVGMGNKNRNSATWDYLPVDTETGGSDSDQSAPPLSDTSTRVGPIESVGGTTHRISPSSPTVAAAVTSRG